MRLKHILRRLFQSPGFTVVTALTLGIGIGANSAIFTVIDGVLLKPLLYPSAERLVAVNHTAPGINFPEAGSAPFLSFTYREEGRAFEASGVWRARAGSITGRGDPEEVRVIDMTAGVLKAVGVPPALGRWFSESDDSPGAPLTAILTNGYWKDRFGGDLNVLGQRIIVDGAAHDIIGVMPQSFRFLTERAALIRPLRFNRAEIFLGDFSYRGIARLKPGMTVAEARADVARMIPVGIEAFPVAPGYSKQLYDEARFAPDLKPLKDEVAGDIGKTLWVLLGTAGVVLAIACTNVANLLLVRAEGREQELTVRAALGASGMQIARELLAESLALGLLGGVLGLGIAYGALRILIAMAPANLPRVDEISIDPAALAFTLAVSLIAGLLFGAIPAIKYAGPRLALSIRAGGRSLSASRERRLTRDILAVVQVALAVVLLVGSGLMIRTFQELRHVDPGFIRPSEVETMHIYIPDTEARDGATVQRLQQNILDRIAAIPGVSSAGIVNMIPMTDKAPINPIWAQDRPEDAKHAPKLRRFKFFSPGFLRTVGARLVAGREFTWTDTYEKRPVAMVSENLSREWWSNSLNAIGKQVHESPASPWREVIGVVGDEREDGVDRDAPQIVYFPLLMNNYQGGKERSQRSVSYAIRSPRTGRPGFLQEIQRAVWSVNSNLPLARVQTLGEIYNKSLARTSFTLVLLVIAAAMALLIGLVGIYGVVSYSVAQRRREVGIRLALGAPKAGLMRMFVGHALLLGAIGAGCGVVAALGMTRLISALLFHVSASDPMTYAAVSFALLIATLFASYIPARQATLVDPIEALRGE